MATTTSPAKFAHDIRQMGTVTQRRQKNIVAQGALTAKEIIVSEAAANGVYPTSRIAGGKWGVRYDIKGFGNPSALVRIYGAFQLVDKPTKPHEIGPRRRGRRRSGKKAIAFDGIVRASVQHPGTRGKNIWSPAKAKAYVAVPKVMSTSVVAGWREALR